jgi:hypothetical protein
MFTGRGGEEAARSVCAVIAEAYAHSQFDLTLLGSLVKGKDDNNDSMMSDDVIDLDKSGAFVLF